MDRPFLLPFPAELTEIWVFDPLASPHSILRGQPCRPRLPSIAGEPWGGYCFEGWKDAFGDYSDVAGGARGVRSGQAAPFALLTRRGSRGS